MFLFFIFRFEYLISVRKSYRDVRETSPKLSCELPLQWIGVETPYIFRECFRLVRLTTIHNMLR